MRMNIVGQTFRSALVLQNPHFARRNDEEADVGVGRRTGVLPHKSVADCQAMAGFTLLEVLVATVILAVAISGLMTALSGSMRVAARLTDYDRAAMLARRKMDEIIADKRLPRQTVLEGGSGQSGWRAQILPFEMPPNPGPGVVIVDRIQVEIWWMNGDTRRNFEVEGFRRHTLARP